VSIVQEKVTRANVYYAFLSQFCSLALMFIRQQRMLCATETIANELKDTKMPQSLLLSRIATGLVSVFRVSHRRQLSIGREVELVKTIACRANLLFGPNSMNKTA
jgi:hypothetical protein